MRFIKRMLPWLLALLCLLGAATAEDAENLLVNGGFEQLDADGLPSGWYTDAWVKREGVTLYEVSANARTGNCAAVVDNLGSNDARFAQRVEVEPETMYRLSGYIMAAELPDIGLGANLSIEDVYRFSESVYDTAGEWQYVELYGETGEDQHELVVYARVGGYSGESLGRAAFDDLRLEMVTELPEGVIAREWYVKSQPQAAAPVVDDVEEEVAAAFWPWLLVLSAVYTAAAVWAMRHIQLDRREDALREAGKQPRAGMPLFVIVGLNIAALARLVTAFFVDGYQVDVNCFTAWGNTMSRVGPGQFYQSNWCDYVPGYVYVMGLNGLIANALNGVVNPAFVHKLVPMACDLIASWLVYRLATENGSTRKQAGLMALLMAFNPAAFLNSAAWCQIDSVLCMGLMLVAYFAIKEKWAVVLPLYLLCALIKPQALMLGFLGLAAIIMAIVRACADRKKGAAGRKHYERVMHDMLIGLGLSAVLALVIVLPFSFGQDSAAWLFELYGDTLSSYPYATVNTANLFYLVDANWEAIAFDASTIAILVMLLLCLVWAAYTFLSRSEKQLSWFVPAMTALALLTVALTGLSVLSLIGGDGLSGGVILSRNAWSVEYDQANKEWVRIFAPDQPGAWYVTLPNWFALMLAALSAAALGLLIRFRRQRAWRIDWSLCEPVIALMFAQIFALMLVFDASWTQFGIFSMALAFFLVLPMFIRSGKYENLPLCGAVIFLLLYVFGIKMHERYVFPALFLLGMAYAIRRDRRILALLVGASAVVFINEGIILDNSLRLGSSMGHLNNDTQVLANLLSLANVALAVGSVWVCHRVCVANVPVRLAEHLRQPVGTINRHAEAPCTPLNFKETSKTAWKRLDVLLVAAVTAIYAVVTLTTLGSTKAPQQPWKSTAYNETVYIDLGMEYEDFNVLYFGQVSYDNFQLSTSVTGEDDDWTERTWAQMNQGECFRWKYVTNSYTTRETRNDGTSYEVRKFGSEPTSFSGRFVRIHPEQIGLILNEIIFVDANGERIDAQVMYAENANEKSPLYTSAEHLLDEQDTLDGQPGWWNSTYFDEIYHARTGFEHLNGTAPYETSHPPLGKVIMSWCIAIFGMTPFGWRFAGALCGILMLPAMYLLVKQLTKRTDMAFVGMMLMALDCMHFTQTRIATIDSFPVLFIILSYFFMLRFMQRDIVRAEWKHILPDLALSGFFMGCGFASKWIGAYAGVGLAVLFFWACARHLRMGAAARRMLQSGKVFSADETELLNYRAEKTFLRVLRICLWCLLFFVAVPLVIYLLSYLPYFAHRDFDSIFDYLKEVWRAQTGMLDYHGTPGLGMDHPFYSPWYEWPLMMRPMYYASPSYTPDGYSYAIFCFGNPWVWLVGLAGIGYTVYKWLKAHRYQIGTQEQTFQLQRSDWDVAPAFVLIGLLAQFLPWVLVPRGTYIYHYFASVPFLILGTVLLLDAITRKHPKQGRVTWIVYLALCLIWFVLLFPYASGVLTPEGWMDFIRDYPYINLIPEYWNSEILSRLNEILEKIPVFPHVYH